MSQEAVNAVLSDARAAYAAGLAKPRRLRFGGFECCLLGAASKQREMPADANMYDFAEAAGLTTREMTLLTYGWDSANAPDGFLAGVEVANEPAFRAARALYRELVPQP